MPLKVPPNEMFKSWYAGGGATKSSLGSQFHCSAMQTRFKSSA